MHSLPVRTMGAPRHMQQMYYHMQPRNAAHWDEREHLRNGQQVWQTMNARPWQTMNARPVRFAYGRRQNPYVGEYWDEPYDMIYQPVYQSYNEQLRPTYHMSQSPTREQMSQSPTREQMHKYTNDKTHSHKDSKSGTTTQVQHASSKSEKGTTDDKITKSHTQTKAVSYTHLTLPTTPYV